MSTSASEVAPERTVPTRPFLGAIRWAIETPRPFAAVHGILATERLRTVKIKQYEQSGWEVAPALRGKIDGDRITDDHQHAHWLWLDQDEEVRDLVLWMPNGALDVIQPQVLTQEADLSGYRRWNPEGFQSGRLHLAGLGPVASVVPELMGPSMTWSSRTPYLSVMHRKRHQSSIDWIAADIARECSYRGISAPIEVSVDTSSHDRAPAAQYRRRRWSEPPQRGRSGHWVRVRFPVPVSGPLSLGGLSHFGFGLFEPFGS